ncbi:MAG TPA: translation initiation factor IF-2 [Clostridiaceae bacterium]|nr:translation initiation factor IF-2 [Clostridiaceae bacterium]
MAKREEANSGLMAGFVSEDEAKRQQKEAELLDEQQELPEEKPEPAVLPVPEKEEKRVDPQDDSTTIEMKGISGKSIPSVIKVIKKTPKVKKDKEDLPAKETKAKKTIEAEVKAAPAVKEADKPEKAAPATKAAAPEATEAKVQKDKKTVKKAEEAKVKAPSAEERPEQKAVAAAEEAAAESVKAVPEVKPAEKTTEKIAPAAKDKATAAEAAVKTAAQIAKAQQSVKGTEVQERIDRTKRDVAAARETDGVRRDTGVKPTQVTKTPYRPQSGSYVGRGADAPAVDRRGASAARPQSERRSRDDRGQTGRQSKPSGPGRQQRSFDRKPAASFGDKDRDEAPRQTRSPKQPVKQQQTSAPAADKKSATRNQYAQRNKQGRRHEPRRNQAQIDREEMLASRMRQRAQHHQPSVEQQKQAQILTNVKLPESLTVKELAEALKKTTAEIIMKLMGYGVMATVNQEIDYDTAEIIANEFEIKAEKLVEVTAEEILFDETPDREEDLLPRPPVVVVMGHVDHGKTSILDYIRKESVVSDEAGGITQKIGAYTVDVDGQQITFIDTPGHEAFTTMRARGAKVTDLAVLVVAADDGVMPQTIEAIHHARAAGTEILVAINKIDKPNTNIDRVLNELAQHDLIGPEWGGSTTIVQVSAKTGENMDELLSMILLTTDVLELKANPNRQAKGTVIEAKLDRSRGPVATLLVQRGTLNVGDTLVVGSQIGHIRAMQNDKGQSIDSAGPSVPVEIMGLSEVPEGGEVFYEVVDERMARALVERRREQERETSLRTSSKMSLDNLFSQIGTGVVKDLNIIVKADLKGSVEALTSSLEKLTNEEVQVKVIHGAVGAITETDIRLAEVSDAIVIGFSVRPAANVLEMAAEAGVDIRLYRVIYHAIEDIEKAMKGMLDPKYKEVVLGHADVREVFKISGVGAIAGCYVTDGKILRNSEIRVVRDGIVIFEGKIESLRRFKDDVREVAAGYECGIGIERFNDIKEGDQFESFEMQEIKRD